MKRLVVVSNRVSPPTGDGKGNQGGLAVALAAALRKSGGIWFGWSGEIIDSFTGQIKFNRAEGVATATIDLEEQDTDEYYNGFANKTLWPLFHDRVDLTEFERQYEGGYARVNRRFAETMMPLVEKNDLVWVHDYHLIPLASELRQCGLTNRIGFFLHTPWPPMRLLMSLPSHRKLVEAFFAYDVIGFQSEGWMESFLYYVREQFEEAEVSDDGIIKIGGRTIRALSCPIGIDTADFVAQANSPQAEATRKAMHDSVNGRALIIGVDRLDYSKGLSERFLGYERFLAEHADFHDKVALLQIAPPSREDVATYQEIRRELDSRSGHINGEFATALWVPVRYVNRGYPRVELAGMYRAARIGLVTPLRDGMNLVAKEYVAAQDPEDPGILILSRFAGAAAQLTDALLINPFSAEEMADAIAAALAMPKDERIRRWRAMMDNIEREDVSWWLDKFVRALTASGVTPATA